MAGFGLFIQQSRALLVKNAILSWRNITATVLQLGASLFFIFLIWCVERAISARNSSTTYFKDLAYPQPKAISGIPACETGYYIKTPCYDFLWSGNDTELIISLVRNVSANNPGRSIDFGNKTLGFATAADVDAWLLANPYRTTGALHFQQTASGLGFGIQTNSTSRSSRGQYEDPTFKFQVPLQAAAERELARYLAQDWSLEWTPSYTEYAHPAIETISAVGTVGPTFLLAAAMFGFVIQMGNLVGERELKLRQAMATMGLLDSAYWSTWLLWEILLSIVSSLLLVLFGMAFQFRFFLTNGFFVVFFVFFLFSLSMISIAFMLSTFISKASSATTVGFLVFIVGFVTQLVVQFGFPYDTSFSKGLQDVWSIFPPNLLAIALIYLGDATATNADHGIKWSHIGKCSSQDLSCVITIREIYFWFLALFVVFFILALYFDNVFPDVNGVRKPTFFFLYPSFWFGTIRSKEGGGCFKCVGKLPPLPPPEGPDDEDVAAEAAAMQRSLGAEGEDTAVSIRGLVKTFPGSTEWNSCCRCKRTKPFHAIKGSWLQVEKDTLFCLLGPNGAGKSTTINCLTGIIPATAGNALVYGKSIRNAADMARIRSIMGVCPQFDILWGALTGKEHLRLFANIKGMSPSMVRQEANKLLLQVNLVDAGNVRAGSYSGGMKRRLSVAIALIGDPQIVFLDEPTTGMDPITRRSVWDIIEAAKPGRAIVLTTHSMEEADILGDRIGIMAKGRLRCLGTSIHLKNKFGTGFVVNVAVRSGSAKDMAATEQEIARRSQLVKAFFKERLGVEAVNETKAYINFLVPRNKEGLLTSFFSELRSRKQELGVTDIQLSLTTLEEVFLNIAKAAELESAQMEGRFETITLANGLRLEVPIGAQYVAVPGTASPAAPQGMVVEVHWQQDDAGVLRISHHSDLIPAPHMSELQSSPAPGSGPGYGGPIVGQPTSNPVYGQNR